MEITHFTTSIFPVLIANNLFNYLYYHQYFHTSPEQLCGGVVQEIILHKASKSTKKNHNNVLAFSMVCKLVRERMKQEISLAAIQEEKEKTPLKVLLLGGGNVGKSTILNQMLILYKRVEDKQLREYRHIIFANLGCCVRNILPAIENLHLQLDDDIKDKVFQFSQTKIIEDFEFTREHINDLKSFWDSPAIQQACVMGFATHFDYTFPHFFNSLERIAHKNYMPTLQDILCARKKTTGVIEYEFKVGKVSYKIIDTGGERSERKKWVHVYEDVTAVIYVASLSGYSFAIFEDRTSNSMLEFVSIFGEQLKSAAMIVFLNMRDLFLERLKVAPLRTCFPGYYGPDQYDECIQFISRKFLAENKNEKRKIHIHVICAINTDEVAEVFNKIKHVIQRKAGIL